MKMFYRNRSWIYKLESQVSNRLKSNRICVLQQSNVFKNRLYPLSCPYSYSCSCSFSTSQRTLDTHEKSKNIPSNDINGLDYREQQLIPPQNNTLLPNFFSSSNHDEPSMDLFTMYSILNLQTFSSKEIHDVTQIILSHKVMNAQSSHESQIIDHGTVHQYLLSRFQQWDETISEYVTSNFHSKNSSSNSNLNSSKKTVMDQYVHEQASKFLNTFRPVAIDSTMESSEDLKIPSSSFESHLLHLASTISQKERDLLLPLSLSMVLVGSSVGIINPVMPFVVKSMELTTAEFGMVVSSFGFAKMIGNVPSAILVERHGRKPYLVHSLSLVGIAVGGISIAQNLEHLIACRLVTGLGVAALSTAATLTIADISTPRNRAATMAPIMSGFAAGMCIGPAIGGEMADTVGIKATFGIVGLSYLTIAGLNHFLLSETKRMEHKGGIPNFYINNDMPWRNVDEKKEVIQSLTMMKESLGVFASMREALAQQTELLKDAKIRNVVMMNGFYWIALAGSQMTLLPLMLTSPDYGVAMSASSVGKVYMGMSLVQVLANPIVGVLVDRIGKTKAIIAGTSLISSSMVILPTVLMQSPNISVVSESHYEYYSLAGTMGLWALGGTMLSTAPIAYISDIVTDKRRAQAIALIRTAGDIGFFIGATTTGALADLTGSLDMAMHSSSGLLFAATTWFGVRQFYLSEKQTSSMK